MSEAGSSLSRRRFLEQGLAAGAGMAALPACGWLEEAEMRVCSLAELEERGAVSVKFNGRKILARRLGGELVVFSLICRHKKCTVAWKAEAAEFHCPCHEGVYDQTGEPLDGPPEAPLRRYRHELRGQDLWVLNQWAE